MSYQTINVRWQTSICFLQLNRPEAGNTINATLIEECLQVLAACVDSATVVVLEGLADVFCFGADFREIEAKVSNGNAEALNPEPLYDLWLQLATGPFVSVAHVRGRTNAGGVGFVAASDVVLADHTATFSLSELLFGLYPACVLPFLMRRIGFQKAHYMTLATKPIPVQTAEKWGLVDACASDSDALLRLHLLRLRCLSKNSIYRYKRYMQTLHDGLYQAKKPALEANRAIFSDPDNLEQVARYVKTGQLPWA